MAKEVIYFKKELIDHNGKNSEEPLQFEEATGCKQQKINHK